VQARLDGEVKGVVYDSVETQQPRFRDGAGLLYYFIASDARNSGRTALFWWHAAAFGSSPLCISVRRCIQMSICSARVSTITQPVAYHSQHLAINFAAAYGAAGTSWCCIQPNPAVTGNGKDPSDAGKKPCRTRCSRVRKCRNPLMDLSKLIPATLKS
jgi:hypothetical protein